MIARLVGDEKACHRPACYERRALPDGHRPFQGKGAEEREAQSLKDAEVKARRSSSWEGTIP